MRDRVAPLAWQSRWFHLHPLLRTAVLAWTVLLVAVTVRVAIKSGHSGSVFPTYVQAAQHWLAGENLYTLDISVQFFRYHPAVAVSFAPWAAFPMTLGAILWRLLGAALIIGGLSAWLRHLAIERATPAKQGLLLLLVAPLALQSINNAQVNAHVLGLILLGLAAVNKQRWNVAAGLLAAATLIKLYPAIVALLVVAAYPRSFMWRYFGMLVAGCLVPFATQRPSYVCNQYQLWFDYLQTDTRFGATLDIAYRDLCLVMRLWITPISETAYRAIELGAAALMAAACAMIAKRAEDPKRVAAAILYLGCLWMTLLGPSTESATYTLLGPTAAMLIALPPRGRSRITSRLALTGYALLILPTIATMFPGGKRLQEWGPQPMGAILLLIVVLVDLASALRAARSDGTRRGVSIPCSHGGL